MNKTYASVLESKKSSAYFTTWKLFYNSVPLLIEAIQASVFILKDYLSRTRTMTHSIFIIKSSSRTKARLQLVRIILNPSSIVIEELCEDVGENNYWYSFFQTNNDEYMTKLFFFWLTIGKKSIFLKKHLTCDLINLTKFVVTNVVINNVAPQINDVTFLQSGFSVFVYPTSIFGLNYVHWNSTCLERVEIFVDLGMIRHKTDSLLVWSKKKKLVKFGSIKFKKKFFNTWNRNSNSGWR